MSAFKQAVFDVEEKEDKVLVVSENEVQKDEQNKPLYKVVPNNIQC